MCRSSVPLSFSNILLYFLVPALLWAFPKHSAAQQEVQWLKEQLNILAGPNMAGRGYVEGGGERAATYINDQFKTFGLQSFDTDKAAAKNVYFQPYSFSVNTFPGEMSLKLNKKTLQPGKDYLVHGASKGGRIKSRRVAVFDCAQLSDTVTWSAIRSGFSPKSVYILEHIDKLLQLRKLTIRSLARELTRGTFIIPMPKKLTWLVTTDTTGATLIFVADSVMPHKVKKMEANIETSFVPAFQTQNVVGVVHGTEKPDSFIVFTAHYDHLGKMGREATFYGANDNASGTCMLLYLAKYYASHPQKYSIAFMAFSGEEAGLMGSTYYSNHPIFPLSQIRFVFNMDMMGDATKGITVVNAPAVPREFSLLESINAEHKYVPAVIRRDQTKNSDHYPFSQKGVDAVFIYTNGVKPYYHDINDRPEEVDFEYAPGVIRLIEDFIPRLQN